MIETRTRSARAAVAIVALTALLAACGSSDGKPPPHPTVYAAYVMLGPGADARAFAFARVIVAPADPACPALRGSNGSIAMHLRGNPFGFPVNVCEARIPFGRRFRLLDGADVKLVPCRRGDRNATPWPDRRRSRPCRTEWRKAAPRPGAEKACRRA